MAQNTSIEWTATPRADGTLAPGHTGNLWWGCVAVHEGCANCYAERLSKRWGNDVWGNDKPRKEIKSVWKDLSKFQIIAKQANEIHRVFVGSMMDIFEKPMPVIDSKGELLTEDGNFYWNTGLIRDRFFLDVIPNSPNLMFLLLTKRPSNINKYIPESWKTNPPANVMFGTSPVNQETANKLIPKLLEVKGYKFLSIEPQLSEIRLESNWLIGSPFQQGQIDFVIQGGESGPNKRPFNTDWARITRDECKQFNVPYFFKQIDKVQEIPEDLKIMQFPNLLLHE